MSGVIARDVPDPQRRKETAAYIATMTADLRQLARRNDLPILAYLLDMARLEAEMEATAAVEPAPERS